MFLYHDKRVLQKFEIAKVIYCYRSSKRAPPNNLINSKFEKKERKKHLHQSERPIICFRSPRRLVQSQARGCERASQAALDFLSLQPAPKRPAQITTLHPLPSPAPPRSPLAARLPAATIEEAPEARRRGTPRPIRRRRS